MKNTLWITSGTSQIQRQTRHYQIMPVVEAHIVKTQVTFGTIGGWGFKRGLKWNPAPPPEYFCSQAIPSIKWCSNIYCVTWGVKSVIIWQIKFALLLLMIVRNALKRWHRISEYANLFPLPSSCLSKQFASTLWNSFLSVAQLIDICNKTDLSLCSWYRASRCLFHLRIRGWFGYRVWYRRMVASSAKYLSPK